MAIAKKKTLKDVKVKLMIWGGPGSGKSRFALTAPNPLVIDLEHSTDLFVEEFDMYHCNVDTRKKEISTPALLTNEIIKEIEQGNEYQDCETLIIDPVTDLLESIESHALKEFEATLTGKLKDKKVTDLNQLQKAKWYAYRRRRIRNLLDKIIRLPLNVICVAREKNMWEETNKGMQPTGKTFDGLDIIEYLPDIVIHLEKLSKNNTVAHVKKSRLGNLDDILKVKNWNCIKEALEGKKESTEEKVDNETGEIIETEEPEFIKNIEGN